MDVEGSAEKGWTEGNVVAIIVSDWNDLRVHIRYFLEAFSNAWESFVESCGPTCGGRGQQNIAKWWNLYDLLLNGKLVKFFRNNLHTHVLMANPIEPIHLFIHPFIILFSTY